MALPLQWMPAYSHGGPFTAGQPTVVVVHCTESDNGPAMAEALAGPNWFGGAKAGTSAHKVVDVDSICEGVKRTTVAWHAGPGGNVRGIAYEFCGRVAWSAAKWREPAQLQMLRNAAPHIADDLRAIGAPARWLSLAQLGGGQRGMCTHNDIRLALGGTTHSDPGPNFPYAELLAYVQGDDDMPLSDDDLRKVYQAVWFGVGGAQLIPNLRRDPNGKVGEWPYTTLGAMDGRLQNEIIPPALQPIKDQLARLEQKVATAAPAQAAVSVDAAAVAKALAGDKTFLAGLAVAINDDADRRARDGDPATGPVS